ncbi:diguanylate cyclase [Novosphingobium sp. PS1R-30]|uniref:Diguanylate cyclase n=1 Tax=Novosphingobium anseongense TaxID=3133436 RepID=A0ABU8RQ01_9SPHN
MLVSRALNDGTATFNDNGLSALELYEQAAPLVSIGAWSCDLHSERLTWTGGVFSLFGLSEIPERRAVVEMYGEESRERLERQRHRAIEARAGFSLDADIIRPDGSRRWIRITAATQNANGRAVTLFGMKQDITEDYERWERLRAQAECDPLTGVANRAAFQRFLDRAKDEPETDRVGALLLFDMNGFKQINDLWGHAAGDACLVALGERLRRAFPHASLVSRIGGDEFAVLLPPDGIHAEIEAKVRSRICNLLAPVAWDGQWLTIGVSAGLAFAPEAEELDPQALFVSADRALYAAKADRAGVLVRA